MCVQTACGADGTCDVQKTVQCLEVCKLAGEGSGRPPWSNVISCSAALCDGEYGRLACEGSAMME